MAMRALHHSLSNNQRRMLISYSYFGVKGGDGMAHWLISHNLLDEAVIVYELEWDETGNSWWRRDWYCALTDCDEYGYSLPWPDQMLAFKKILESRRGERHFVATALPHDRSPLRMPEDFVI